MVVIKIIALMGLFLVMACSAAYEELGGVEFKNKKNFQYYIFQNYKEKAIFEAEEMHDWNSAKLYSEKALKAKRGYLIYPEKIEYWKISSNKIEDLTASYKNLLSIYDQALIINPEILAKAISSLDCWFEQEEEKWQNWDIQKCKNDFHSAMHELYFKISDNSKSETNVNRKKNTEEAKTNRVTIVTENYQNEPIQIIYFDFDNFELSEVSINTLTEFVEKNKINISKFIVVGHTDTRGTNKYNLELSLKRANKIKEILIKIGIKEKDISVIGKGENDLAISTPNDFKHPANRRAEIKILN
tara:strand:+ start:4061 stop:4963 length:903 start_codon:yes stop_codon:yes gene_type:complete